MKGEVRAFRPTLASFQAGRANARDSRLLERIQERQRDGWRQASLTLGRRRDEKPALYGQQARVLVLDTGSRKPAVEREVEAVSFEGTGKTHRGRTGPLAAAVAAGLLAIIAPSLGTAEPTRAAATVQIKTDNPFGFKKGKTSVREIGKLLGAKGIEEMEWVLEEFGSVTTLLVADGVKAVYHFKEGLYRGCIIDLNDVHGLDLSIAKNWAVSTSYQGLTFVTAENFLASDKDGVFKPAVYIIGVDAKGILISNSHLLDGIIAKEGGFREPTLTRRGKVNFLHAKKSDGTPWENAYGFRGDTGELLGTKPAAIVLSLAIP